MTEEERSDAFYERLKKELKEDTSWPSTYLYKFIVPADLEKIAEIEATFDGLDAEINTRDSSKGNFTSISIKVIMDSPEAVVEKYREVSKVEGVISL